MKRQRSKAELLLHMRTYQALKKDAENKESISGKTVYWRMAVEWCTALWKEEKFSTNELAKFLQYIADNNVTELTEERREEIRKAQDNQRKVRGRFAWSVRRHYDSRSRDNHLLWVAHIRGILSRRGQHRDHPVMGRVHDSRTDIHGPGSHMSGTDR